MPNLGAQGNGDERLNLVFFSSNSQTNSFAIFASFYLTFHVGLPELQRVARYLHSMVQAENGPDDFLPQIQCLQCHRIKLETQRTNPTSPIPFFDIG